MSPGRPDMSAHARDPDLVQVPVLETVMITERMSELILARPQHFTWRAGQRIPVCHKGVCREYSLASGETDDRLRLLVTRFTGGAVSPVLCTASAGSRLDIGRPKGYFRYRSQSRPAVFVATGTGIAPFVAMARSGVTGFTVLHGVSHEKALYAADGLKAAARNYVPCISPEADRPGFFSGRVTHYLAKHLAPGPYDFYLCGNQLMIRDAAHVVDGRFSGSRIFTEAFY